MFTLLGDRKLQGEERGLNIYPLWWSWSDEDSSTRMLLPFFYDERAGTNRTLLTPLGGRGWSTDGSTRFVNVLGPIFHRSQSEDQTTTSFLWPLFERSQRDQSTSTRVWPIFRHESEDSGNHGGWFAAGTGAYHKSEDSKGWRMWPLASAYKGASPDPLYDLGLFEWSEHQGRRQRRVYPLFSRNIDEDSDRLTLAAGLAHHHRSNAGTSTRVLPLFSVGTESARVGPLDKLTLFARHRDESSSYTQFGTGLGLTHARWDRESRTGRSTRVLGLFETSSEDRVAPEVPSPQLWNSADLIERSETRFLFGWFKWQNERYQSWSDDAPFADEARQTLSRVSKLDPAASDRRTLERFAEARELLARHGVDVSQASSIQAEARTLASSHIATRKRHHTRLPLLFETKREGDEREWSALLGLLRSESDKDSSRFRLAYALYKRETEGERTTRDLFPFVTWDSAPEETSVSFLWRVFRYRNDHGDRSGHFLFVPWGG